VDLNLLVDAASLTALFKHIGSVDEPSTDEIIREKVLSFIRDKVRRLACVVPIASFTLHLGDLVIAFADLSHQRRTLEASRRNGKTYN
jgi:hypothetical protein